MPYQQGSLELTSLVRILIVLFADVRLDLLQLESDGGTRVASRPEMFARNIALLAPKLPGNGNCALPFQEADHLRHRHLGGNGDTHMDVIRQDMPLNNRTFLLPRQRVEDGSQLATNLPIQLATPPFGNKHHVVLAVPARMRQAPILVFHTSSSGCLIKLPLEDYSRIGQTSSSHTGRTSGFPFCSVNLINCAPWWLPRRRSAGFPGWRSRQILPR